MGLDMFSYAITPDQWDGNKIQSDERNPVEKIFYWRKNRHLHNWMEKLYRERGGTEEFNCVQIQLTLDDLSRLFIDIIGEHMEDNGQPGFFFGNSEYDSEQAHQDLVFIAKAIQKIKEGKIIIYDSWW